MNEDKSFNSSDGPVVPKTAFYVNSVGSVSRGDKSTGGTSGKFKTEGNGTEKKKKPGKNDWMKHQYPNRRIRRMYRNSNAKRITTADIESGRNPFTKWYDETVANIIMGQRRDAAFQNEVAHRQMVDEQIIDSMSLRSFVATFGESVGNRMFNENKKIYIAMTEKKMSLHHGI